MPVAYRLFQTKYAKNAFDGEGARIYPGRWNPAGVRMVYTAQSLSLAVLEILVHISAPAVLNNYSSIAVSFDDKHVADVRDVAKLPRNWQDYPAPPMLKEIGRAWTESEMSLVLAVPSVVVPSEHNFLINPAHPDFDKMKIDKPVKFKFDERLVK